MSCRSLLAIAGIAVLCAAAPVAAQDTVHAAADAQEKPVTDAMNTEVKSATDSAREQNAANQDQYELDRAAYRAAVAARHEKIAIDNEAYARQQTAYADAMRAWRIQSDACKKGKTKACNAPTPVPADFY